MPTIFLRGYFCYYKACLVFGCSKRKLAAREIINAY